MGFVQQNRARNAVIGVACIFLLILCSACQSNASGQPVTSMPGTRSTPTAQQTATPSLQIPQQKSTSTPVAAGATSPRIQPTSPTQPTQPTQPPPPPQPTQPGSFNPNHPVLAFYYMWYTPSTWSLSTMSDLPTIQYNSSDPTTIARQVNWAANAGITGFISSWWGPGSATDNNFVQLLSYSATLQQQTGHHFASSIYFESDSPQMSSEASIVTDLKYLIAHYTSSPYFFHWNGKPVIFIWDPLGGGRTLAEWASIRSQVDPNDSMIWSAEGVSMSLLSVFDGIHLFSAGYWGIQNTDMTAVAQGFRNEINTYNSANHTQKIWAAGVLPGYNDTRVPGRTGTYIVPRNNGATYTESWQAAIASSPSWITITSFNEWFEGSMIEPSVTYGNLYLNLTAQFTRQW